MHPQPAWLRGELLVTAVGAAGTASGTHACNCGITAMHNTAAARTLHCTNTAANCRTLTLSKQLLVHLLAPAAAQRQRARRVGDVCGVHHQLEEERGVQWGTGVSVCCAAGAWFTRSRAHSALIDRRPPGLHTVQRLPCPAQRCHAAPAARRCACPASKPPSRAPTTAARPQSPPAHLCAAPCLQGTQPSSIRVQLGAPQCWLGERRLPIAQHRQHPAAAAAGAAGAATGAAAAAAAGQAVAGCGGLHAPVARMMRMMRRRTKR